ncbi:MAG: DUF5706 domain-containing protein [Pedobacter sp.]|uniref:Pycsar system effector family protein n=1 Tax=Pedobacter sp. TaxID=1411316 RepID=UPI0028096346|nr:Pycsar system effector family protein [Pedobacter sp.]MDQ8006474.1 DUF5706 domain-containing protein [Pedobacter sp.]
MNYAQIQLAAETYVKQYFKEHQDSNLLYHGLEHTLGVVEASTQIANHYQLSPQDFFIVYIGAWFHDIGYLKGEPGEHEVAGAKAATDFLQQHQVAEETITAVSNAILATKLPQQPKNLNEQILCDADLFHLGSEGFTKRSKLLRSEISKLCHKEIGKKDWWLKDLAFLESHRYHTDYCRLSLDDKKAKHIAKLIKKLQKDETQPILHTTTEQNPVTEPSDKLKPQKEETGGKGVETMFRITSTNNQRLSDMADNKAQILITVNSIMLSLIVSLLLRRLEDNEHLIIPTMMLLLVSLSCIVFSILATRPSIPAGTFTQQDVADKKVNLVFFGNFYKMPLEEYHQSMKKVMGDKDFLYGTLIKDVYSQGVVLGKKYKLIRIAYNIFMFGLIGTVLAYIISYAAYGKLF